MVTGYYSYVKATVLNQDDKARLDYDLVSISYADGDSATSVTQNLIFNAAVINSSTVTWRSSNTGLISDNGALVRRPTEDEGNTEVTIVATITNGSAQLTKQFTILVIKKSSTLAEDLQADKDNLAIGYYAGDDADNVTTHVLLPVKGALGSTITWESDNEALVNAEGTVVRKDTDDQATLTATISLEGAIDTKIFTLTVKATDNNDILKQILDDTNALQIVYADGDTSQFVTKDLYLRTLEQTAVK
jgi:hypothetical protein